MRLRIVTPLAVVIDEAALSVRAEALSVLRAAMFVRSVLFAAPAAACSVLAEALPVLAEALFCTPRGFALHFRRLFV